MFFFFSSSEYNNTKFEVSHVHKVECVVPWLNDTLVFFTISLQLCQQLKDKVGVACWYGNDPHLHSHCHNLRTMHGNRTTSEGYQSSTEFWISAALIVD